MRKFLLRITCGLLTFTSSFAVVNLGRKPAPAISFGPSEHLGTPNPVYRCDEAPKLALPIQVLLNRTFIDWSFPQVREDDCYSIRENGGPDVYPHLIKGDFNDDGREDYAVLIQQGARVTNGGAVKPLIIHIVTFFRRPDGFQMHHVTDKGGGSLILMRKGETDYDYEKQREFTYPRDALFSGMGMGGTSYLYEYGLFRAITTSD